MNKNIIVPLSIIIVAVIAGAVILFTGGDNSANKQLSNTSNNLRVLELSVPGMFCAGCTSSVEGYVSSMPGVKRVQARLTPTKSASVVYDSGIVTKEEIIKNSVFNLYGVSIVSDDFFKDSVFPTVNQKEVIVPKEIQKKSQQVIFLLKQKTNEKKDVSSAKSLFNQVNSDIESGDFANANTLLDTIIGLLSNL